MSFDHNRLLKKTAAEALEPMGLYQIGSSRTWVDDHIWWTTVVEFTPSGFGRGSYLRVGVTLLWRPVGVLAFDTDFRDAWKTPMGRLDSRFIEARRPDSWERDVRAFATDAMAHIASVRGRRNDLDALRVRLDSSDDFWDRYHRAVASGLLGDVDGSKRDFGTIVAEPNPFEADWLPEVQAAAHDLVLALVEPGRFADRITADVMRCRSETRLRPIDTDEVRRALAGQ